MKIELYPLDKMVIDGKTVSLGMEQTAVENALGEGKTIRKRHYYFGNELAVDYDADGKVQFIEFLGGIDGALKPTIYGVSAFDTPADELTELLERENNGEIDDSEGEYSRAFLEISVGLYRSVVPSEEDEISADHWETIGIGAVGYYRK